MAKYSVRYPWLVAGSQLIISAIQQCPMKFLLGLIELFKFHSVNV